MEKALSVNVLVSCCLDESGANVGGNIPPSFTDCVTVSDRNTCSRINNSFLYCSTLSTRWQPPLQGGVLEECY